MDVEKLLKRVKLGFDAAVPKKELDGRVRALQAMLRKRGIDLYLTSGAENIFYLSGQQTPGYYMFQCLGLPAEGEPFLFMRGGERFNARANTFTEDIQGYDDSGNPGTLLASLLKQRGWKGKRIAVDRNAWFLTVNIYERLAEALGKITEGAGLAEELRREKSKFELASMQKASVANDAGMKAGLKAVRAGVTENDVAAVIMGNMIKSGSEYLGMEPFVTSGPRGGLMHSTWRRRRIRKGDLVAIETSACYNRYHVALFRTVAVGKVPEFARDWYKICLECLETAIATIKPGLTCGAVHDRVQRIVDRNGVTEHYRKRLGYSIGVSFAPDWGEGNILSLNHGVNVELKPGMTFHMPLCLRDYGRFTVAVSETVRVTDKGCKQFSKLSRALVEA